MEYDFALEMFRGGERILIVLFGGLSLFFGWNLFRVGVMQEQRAEFKNGDVSVTLQKVGPGIFFALFGSCILVVAMSNTFRDSEETRSLENGGETTKNVREYFFDSENKDEIYSSVEAFNTILSVSRNLNKDNLKGY